MSKLLDEFEVYDLFGVLFSGITISTFSLLIIRFVYDININVYLANNETVMFLATSCFLGFVFQSISSIIDKTMHKNRALLNQLISDSREGHGMLTKFEVEKVCVYVKNKLNLSTENNIVIYNYCKFWLRRNRNTSKIDKEQALGAMYRSLSLFFLLVFMISIFSWFWKANLKIALLIILSGLISALLYCRFIRFARLRYADLFRSFYYTVIEEEKDNKTSTKKIVSHPKGNNYTYVCLKPRVVVKMKAKNKND